MKSLGAVLVMFFGALAACTSASDYCGKTCGVNAPCATGYTCDALSGECAATDGHCSATTGGATTSSGSTGSTGGGSGGGSSSSTSGGTIGTGTVLVGSLTTLGLSAVTGTMQIVDQGLETTAQTCQANVCLNGGLTP